MWETPVPWRPAMVTTGRLDTGTEPVAPPRPASPAAAVVPPVTSTASASWPPATDHNHCARGSLVHHGAVQRRELSRRTRGRAGRVPPRRPEQRAGQRVAARLEVLPRCRDEQLVQV